MLFVMAASEAASAAAAAALQAAVVSFVTAPGSTATPFSRDIDAAVAFVPTKLAAISWQSAETWRSDGVSGSRKAGS